MSEKREQLMVEIQRDIDELNLLLHPPHPLGAAFSAWWRDEPECVIKTEDMRALSKKIGEIKTKFEELNLGQSDEN